MLLTVIAFAIIVCSDARVVLDNAHASNGHVESSNGVILEEARTGVVNGNTNTDGGICRRCMCKLNGCPEAVFSRCLSAGSLCCCCLPGNHPCLELEEFEESHESSDTLEALEEGIEDIGQLEKK